MPRKAVLLASGPKGRAEAVISTLGTNYHSNGATGTLGSVSPAATSIVVLLATSGENVDLTIGGTLSGSWTKVTSVWHAAGTVSAQVWVCLNPGASGTITATSPGGGIPKHMHGLQILNANRVSPFKQFKTGSAGAGGATLTVTFDATPLKECIAWFGVNQDAGGEVAAAPWTHQDHDNSWINTCCRTSLTPQSSCTFTQTTHVGNCFTGILLELNP